MDIPSSLFDDLYRTKKASTWKPYVDLEKNITVMVKNGRGWF